MTGAGKRPRQVRRGGTEQRGSVAILVVGLTGVLVTVTLLVAAVGGVVADQRRVEAAADLAALAGAGAVQAGRDGCAAARETAGRNGGALRRCALDGDVVTVEVGRDSQVLLGRRLALVGRARAGPVT
jgi:secretion/DNA translocation related TadE-like protein